MRILKDQRGFTLIELVLIIVVLGILAAVAIVNFGNLNTSARDAAIQGAFGAFNSQLAISVGLCRGYPVDATGAEGACDPTTSDFVGNFENSVFNGVSLTGGDLSKGERSQAGPYTFDICSGTAGQGGRFSTVTYTDAVNPPTLTMGAFTTWAAGACGAAT